jgi:alcohol dehydrogenase YqhD (iron-dependent ADH family)
VSRAAILVGEKGNPNSAALAYKSAARLQNLISELGLPTRFGDVHITGEQLRVVANRFAARGAFLLAGQAPTENQVICLLEDAL